MNAAAIATLSAASPPTARVVVLIGAVIVSVVLLGVVLIAIRRAALGGRTQTSANPLDLDALHRQHKAGLLTDEEYRSLRGAAIAAVRGEPIPDGGTPEGDRQAGPGVDLTGEPLPGAEPPGADPGDVDNDEDQRRG